MLDERRNSHREERMNVLKRFERLFPGVQIRCVMASRKFVGWTGCRFLLLPHFARSLTREPSP